MSAAPLCSHRSHFDSAAGRCGSFEVYHAKVRQALNDMVEDRLLCEDAGTEEARLMQAGLDRGVPAPEGGALPAPEELKACRPRRHHEHKDRDHHDYDD